MTVLYNFQAYEVGEKSMIVRIIATSAARGMEGFYMEGDLRYIKKKKEKKPLPPLCPYPHIPTLLDYSSILDACVCVSEDLPVCFRNQRRLFCLGFDRKEVVDS